MKRLLTAIVFIVCLCAFASVSLAYETHFGYFGPPIGDCGTWVCSSGFGPRDAGIGSKWHKGVDIAAAEYDAPDGFAIAAADGVVVAAEEGGGYINYVIIKHDNINDPAFPNGLYTLYGDIVAINSGITEGVTVRKGQILGFCGPYEAWHYEYSSAPHVHWEVRPDTGAGYFNEEALDPALFLSDIEESGYGSSGTGIGDPHMKPANGPFGEFEKIIIEFKYEMLKGFRSIFQGVANAIIIAFQNIHKIIRNIFILLIMIDLALGAMNLTFGDKDTGLATWLTGKFIFYGCMLLLLDRWPDLSNHFVKDYFLAGTGKAMSMSEAEVAKVISDPMMILEKGLHIIQPLVNNCLDFQLPTDFTSFVKFAMLPGSSVIMFIFTAIGCLIFLLLLLFLAVLIALSYLEFYIFMLFAFTTLIFAGTHVTRQTRLANRGITAVFAGALNLMFYAMLSVLLVQSMGAIADQAKRSEIVVEQPATGTPIKDVEDFKMRLRNMETGGRKDPYHDRTMTGTNEADGQTIDGYGAYHIPPSDWESWTEQAYAEHAPLYPSMDGGEYPTPGCRFRWTPTNQEAVVTWKLQKDYEATGNWETVARQWYNRSGPHSESFDQYWSAIAKKPLNNAPAKRKTGTNSLLIIVQLNICLLVFVVLAIRMSSTIHALFKGGGFELLNSMEDH